MFFIHFFNSLFFCPVYLVKPLHSLFCLSYRLFFASLHPLDYTTHRTFNRRSTPSLSALHVVSLTNGPYLDIIYTINKRYHLTPNPSFYPLPLLLFPFSLIFAAMLRYAERDHTNSLSTDMCCLFERARGRSCRGKRRKRRGSRRTRETPPFVHAEAPVPHPV